MYPPIHKKPEAPASFERLDSLWERYPQYHTPAPFTTLDALLEDHPSYQKDFEELREEYLDHQYEKFLVQLSWSDLPYRHKTRQLIENRPPIGKNPYVEAFMDQFRNLDTDHKACFLIPESFLSQYFVAAEVCRRAEGFHPIRNLFPDEETLHYLAVFDKQKMDDVQAS